MLRPRRNAMFSSDNIWKVLACGVFDRAVLFWEKCCDCDLPITNCFRIVYYNILQ